MAETSLSATTTTGLKSISDYSVAARQTDGTNTGEIVIDFPNFTTYYGYYRQIPELKKAIDALAIWVTGKGFETDTRTWVRARRIRGHGKDTISSILFNLFVIKKVNGDAFAEIIEDGDRIINLKPLSPQNVRMYVNSKGMISKYEYNNNGNWITIPKENMLHLVNDRVADEPRGTSVIEACKWVIDARNEAMSDWRKLLHRSTIRIIEVDSDDTAKITQLKNQWKEAIKNGEAIVVPRGNVGFPESPVSRIDGVQDWIQYLENFFYQAVGVPRVIATSENYTEAASKVGYLTFEPIYTREQTQLEEEIRDQLGIILTFDRPPSLMKNAQSDEAANTGQMGFQPNDVTAGSGAA